MGTDTKDKLFYFFIYHQFTIFSNFIIS